MVQDFQVVVEDCPEKVHVVVEICQVLDDPVVVSVPSEEFQDFVEEEFPRLVV